MFSCAAVGGKIDESCADFQGIDYQRTHDFHKLASLLLKHGITTPCSPEELTQLSPFAVTFRYDDTDIPFIQNAVVEKMVDTMRHWAWSVLK